MQRSPIAAPAGSWEALHPRGYSSWQDVVGRVEPRQGVGLDELLPFLFPGLPTEASAQPVYGHWCPHPGTFICRQSWRKVETEQGGLFTPNTEERAAAVAGRFRSNSRAACRDRPSVCQGLGPGAQGGWGMGCRPVEPRWVLSCVQGASRHRPQLLGAQLLLPAGPIQVYEGQRASLTYTKDPNQS